MTAIFCGCGKRMHTINDGKDCQYVSECEICTANGGNWTKSPYWDHERDKEDRRRIREAQAEQAAMKDVIPIKGKGKKASHAARKGK